MTRGDVYTFFSAVITKRSNGFVGKNIDVARCELLLPVTKILRVIQNVYRFGANVFMKKIIIIRICVYGAIRFLYFCFFIIARARRLRAKIFNRFHLGVFQSLLTIVYRPFSKRRPLRTANERELLIFKRRPVFFSPKTRLK